MKIDWSRFGIVGLLFLAIFGGIFEEGRSSGAATLLVAVSLILLGILLTQLIVGWWRGISNDPPVQENHVEEGEEGP